MTATHDSESTIPSVVLPAPTVFPMALIVGVTLLFAGLLTHIVISLIGTILLVAASVGWFREVLPHEQHESVPLELEPLPIGAARRQVARLEVGELDHRARLPQAWRADEADHQRGPLLVVAQDRRGLVQGAMSAPPAPHPG